MLGVENSEKPELISVADGLVIRQGIDNIGWADMGDYVLLVDALEKASEADEVLESLRETMGNKALRYVVNTHIHPDHVALNSFLERRCRTKIVNAETYKQQLSAEGGMAFTGSRRRCRIIPMPGVHTAQDVVVWFPDDGVLFTGDIFGWGLIPAIGRISNEVVDRLQDIYRTLIAWEPETVIPGHGPLASVQELERFSSYVDWLWDTSQAETQKGKIVEEIKKDLTPPADMQGWWRFVDWKHAHNVQRILP